MRKAGIIVGVLLTVGGLAIVAVAVVNGVQGFVGALTPVAQWSTPGTHRAQLSAGDWVVFQAAPQGAPTRSLIPWDEVTVTGPKGRVATSCGYCGSSETLTLGRDHYVGILRFTADTPGSYAFTTETSAADLVLAPPALQTVGGVFASLGLIAVGALVALVGVGLLIAVIVVHFTRKQAPPPTTWAPPTGPPV